MKLTISTDTLQNMMSKAMKGASNNKMIPLTNLICMELKNNVLTLITTDASNYLYVHERVVGDDFYAVIPIEVFAKLISRLTCDEVVLSIENNTLTVSGNGTYVIELPIDENGMLVKYPDPRQNFVAYRTENVSIKPFRLMLDIARPSLLTTYEMPCYTGYYVADKIVTTNSLELCSINCKVFDTPCLLSAPMVELFEIMSGDIVAKFGEDNEVMFVTDDVEIYGSLMDCIGDFQIDTMNNLLADTFSGECSVSKDNLLELLDRLSLFVGAYDKNALSLTFSGGGLLVQSKQASGAELIKYSEFSYGEDFSCYVDIEKLRNQVRVYEGKNIRINYGNENMIKLISDDVQQIICTMTI